MSGSLKGTAHFEKSFFYPTPEMSFHLPPKQVKDSPYDLCCLGIVGGKLQRLDNRQGLPQGAETDLWKIREFICEHGWELEEVPFPGNDQPIRRTIAWLFPVDFLIEKHNAHVENNLLIRIASIFLLILTLGIYNYKSSFLIDPLTRSPGTATLAPMVDAMDDFLAEKGMAKRDRILEEQQWLNLARNNDLGGLANFGKKYPGVEAATMAKTKPYPASAEVCDVATIAKENGFVAFYRSGPTASLSLFAKCPNGIHIYDKKFSCIASAFEYKRCEVAGCTAKELEKFPSLDGEAALEYGKTLTTDATKQQALQKANWKNNASAELHVMIAIIRAKYAQNLEMLSVLAATGSTSRLLCHAPEGTTENYWSDGGNGLGENQFGNLLQEFRLSLDKTYQGPAPTKIPDDTLAQRFKDSGNYRIW